jgi:hypothetical protein
VAKKICLEKGTGFIMAPALIKKKVFVILLLLVVSVISSGCVAVKAGTSLDLGQSPGLDCVPGEKGAVMMFGDTFVRHVGDEEVTITGISLVNPEEITLAEAVLVELGDKESLVGFGEWPPTDEIFPLPAEWENRVEAAGTVLEPGAELNLIVALQSNADDTASAQSLAITYENAAGKEFEQKTLVSYFITSRTCEEIIDENHDY